MRPGPGTSAGPRQPPTPPPSSVVEPPEPSSDQAKVKFWRDRNLSWKAKIAADWTQWWEHHSHEFTPLPHERSSTEISQHVYVSDERTGRRTARPSRSSTRGLGEETLQEMEALEEYTLDSFDSMAEPTSQAVMVCVTGYDRDDLEGRLPCASRLEHAELVEMARRSL